LLPQVLVLAAFAQAGDLARAHQLRHRRGRDAEEVAEQARVDEEAPVAAAVQASDMSQPVLRSWRYAAGLTSGGRRQKVLGLQYDVGEGVAVERRGEGVERLAQDARQPAGPRDEAGIARGEAL